MKILVISDTHGQIKKVLHLFEKLKNIDLIIHCGDFSEDGKAIEKILDIPVVSVRGNCDMNSNSPSEAIVSTPHGDILVVHGHKEGVDYDLSRLSYKAEANGCIAACFGHTHMPVYTQLTSILLMNPGSLSLPRDNTNGSYGIIHSESDNLYGAIVYYDTIFPKEKKDSKRPGNLALKNLLNYSDRF